MADYDLIVIGGGPAGYVGAIRAGQLGKKVACVEMDRAGGTCLNWGCIPTKALLKNAELYHTLAHRSEEFGLTIQGLGYDWEKIIGRSRGISERLAGGIEFLFKKNKVDYFPGFASMAGDKTVEITAKDGSKKTISADNILLSTGCKSRELPFLPYDGTKVISSKEAMVIPKQPKSIIIIGAGAIGCEFAYFFNAYGTKVTVVEMADHLLPVEDNDVSKELEKCFKKDGIGFMTKTKTVAAEVTADSVRLAIEPRDGGEQQVLEAEVCLVAVGVQPVLPGNSNVALGERGYIETDDRYQTNVPGVYAAGDIIGPPWLAHVASFEAIQCVEGMFTEGFTPKKVDIFPGCTYCHPEVGSIGLTEQACKDQGIEYRVGKFPLQASGRALAVGETAGFSKLIFGKEHGELLGAHLIGASATEMIAEMSLGMTLEVTAEEIESTIHAHPTMSEAIHEATGDAFGHAIHF